MTDEEWCRAGGAGFVGAAAGAYAFFDKLRATYPYSGAVTEGPQAVFGRICLEFYRDESGLRPAATAASSAAASRSGPAPRRPACLVARVGLADLKPSGSKIKTIPSHKIRTTAVNISKVDIIAS